MTIDILCKVVDNFGDIGVVYRLARALSELPGRPRLRLVVDDLRAFSLLDPDIHATAGKQLAHGWEIFPWDGGASAGESRAAFLARPSRILLECFACGRPDWLEELLFDPAAGECFVTDLEHLTAEAYAEEFHCMPSLTRSKSVRKAMFLPGFAAGTGGLTMDKAFALSLVRASSEAGRAKLRRELLAKAGCSREGLAASAEAFWVCVFGYERDYSRVVADLAAYADGGGAGQGRPLLVLAAAGKSQDCFLRAWEAGGKAFPALALPFLAQEEWDAFLAASDFSIVRGEDSWSRAALAGAPFLWQAYPQEGRHQLVKVAAFLDRLRPHFEGEAEAAAFSALEKLYLAFNDRERDGRAERGLESLLPVLEAYSDIRGGFSAFSASLKGNGNLAANLVTFLREIV